MGENPYPLHVRQKQFHELLTGRYLEALFSDELFEHTEHTLLSIDDHIYVLMKLGRQQYYDILRLDTVDRYMFVCQFIESNKKEGGT